MPARSLHALALPFALPIAIAGAGLLSACAAVGPDYAGPPAVATPARFARADEATTGAAGAPLDAWWTALGDPALDRLVERALAANPSLAAARARLQHARAALGLQRANGAPSASATALYAHAHLPPISLGGSSADASGTDGSAASSSALPSDLNLYTLGFDATWELDLFGGQRRAVEGAKASLAAAQANLADAQVSLSAEVAQAYVNLRDCQQRSALNQAAIARQERMLELTAQRQQGGTASRLEVVKLRNQLESTRADALPLDAQRDAWRDELALLVDQPAGALDAELAAAAPVPLPPATVAIGDPAALLQRRPDVRAAERTLAARSAAIGQAEAARFPKVSLLGLIGLGGTSLSALGHLDDYSAVVAPELSWNFLDFGRAKARVEQARADDDEALANYRQAVNRALNDAEGALSRYGNRRRVVATLARSLAAADEAQALAQQRYAGGTASLIELLDAERQQIAAQQGLSQAEAGLTTDYVALQKALGLGWGSQAPA